ncbi:hypothetical protein ACFX13_030496 [Malus domestica]
MGLRSFFFFFNGVLYYGNIFNAYWLIYRATEPSQREKVSAAFREVTNNGLTIAKTWAFADGGYRALQTFLGSYDEKTFQISIMASKLCDSCQSTTTTPRSTRPTSLPLATPAFGSARSAILGFSIFLAMAVAAIPETFEDLNSNWASSNQS